jgi:CRISPR-associated protein Cmr2
LQPLPKISNGFYKGADDPAFERLQCETARSQQSAFFQHEGSYWHWQGNPSLLPQRPLFTPGRAATIQFNVIVAHRSVPLSIALAHLWKMRHSQTVQVQVLNNNQFLIASGLFETFNLWRSIVQSSHSLKPVLLEQLVEFWHDSSFCGQTIETRIRAFCDRYSFFHCKQETRLIFETVLVQFLQNLWEKSQPKKMDEHNRYDLEVQNWLNLAVFLLRHR